MLTQKLIQSIKNLFAFQHQLLPEPDQNMDGWYVYNAIEGMEKKEQVGGNNLIDLTEFTRMGIPGEGWAIASNKSYSLCPTYPQIQKRNCTCP